MSPRTVFLARLSGLFLIAMSAPLLLNKASMVDTVTAIVHQPALLLTFGMVALAAGLAMVIGHNVWSGGAATVAVTIVGWVLLFKGLVCLVLPPAAMVGLFEIVRFSDYFYGYVAVYLLAGLFLAYSSFGPTISPRGVVVH